VAQHPSERVRGPRRVAGERRAVPVRQPSAAGCPLLAGSATTGPEPRGARRPPAGGRRAAVTAPPRRRSVSCLTPRIPGR